MSEETAAKFVLFDFEVVALVALALGIIAYAPVRYRRRALAPEGTRVDFDLIDLVLVFFPAMLFLLNPITDALLSAKADGAAGDADPAAAKASAEGVLAVLTNLGYFVFVGVMTYGLIEWVRNRRVVELFGLKRRHLSEVIVISILGGVFSLLGCAWLIGDFSSQYIEEIFGKLDAQEPVRMIRESESSLHTILSVLLACVVAPCVEEMLFRGYLYGTVRRLTHPIFAIIVVGALFAVVHANLPALLPLWAFSILLCAAYEWSGSLWVPIGIHSFFNAANIVLMMTADSPN